MFIVIAFVFIILVGISLEILFEVEDATLKSIGIALVVLIVASLAVVIFYGDSL